MNIYKVVKTALLCAAIVFVIGAVIGTLVTPVVLSLHFSWYWIFLYVLYLLVTVLVILHGVRYWHEDERSVQI